MLSETQRRDLKLRDNCHDFLSGTPHVSTIPQQQNRKDQRSATDYQQHPSSQMQLQRQAMEQQRQQAPQQNQPSSTKKSGSKAFPTLFTEGGEKIKKPMSPFLLFYSQNYHRIAKQYPGNPFTEMMTIVSKEWKELPKEQQDVYMKRFQVKKQKYQAEYNKQILQHRTVSPEQVKKKVKADIVETGNNDDLKSMGSIDMDYNSNSAGIKVEVE